MRYFEALMIATGATLFALLWFALAIMASRAGLHFAPFLLSCMAIYTLWWGVSRAIKHTH